MNGMARGMVPADHPVAFSRVRSKALGEADVAVVVGVPMDFRLSFGAVFGPQTELIVVDRVEPDREHPRAIAAGLYGDLSATLAALADTSGRDHEDWIARLRAAETAARDLERAELADERVPLHPMRVYAELAPLLERDAVVVIDAGDFGSYGGRVIDSYVPGAWLDSGPFGCLGSGRVTRWPPSWPSRSVRWCCCKATVRSGFPGWSGTRWFVTVCRSSRWSATTASGRWKNTPWKPCTAIRWRPSCGPAHGMTRWHASWAATASWCRRPPSCVRLWNVRSAAGCPPSSTCSPIPRSPTLADRIWPDRWFLVASGRDCTPATGESGTDTRWRWRGAAYR
ncbi:acetolactate synthase domain protein [Mycobacterium xenopi 4042]|uniref:acetolactate synthase n=1 Tax=Mycobacterium xenopi 4042 TaxID=1299334 RepID=X8BHS6_MYCXE|nr:acetolactate synthase domain protein [Mycobacterium xenopi 4042]